MTDIGIARLCALIEHLAHGLATLLFLVLVALIFVLFDFPFPRHKQR